MSGGELERSASSEGRRDGVDQRRGYIVDNGHAGADSGGVSDPVGDVVGGAQRQSTAKLWQQTMEATDSAISS